MAKETLLTSTAVAKRLGVTVSTVKRWADEGLLAHVRTAGGHRRFRESDVGEMEQSATASQSNSQYWIDLLLSDRSGYAIQAELLTQRDRLGSWCHVAKMLGTVLEEVGLRWMSGALAIHEEHRMSARLIRALATCAESISTSNESPTCILVVPEGEEHTMGLSLLEPCLRELGWRSAWLGRHTPMRELVSCIETGKYASVAVSASDFSLDGAKLAQWSASVGTVCRKSGTNLWLGGSGRWPENPEYGQRVRSFQDLMKIAARP